MSNVVYKDSNKRVESMMLKHEKLVTVIILLIFIFGYTNFAESSIRTRGSLGVKSYSFQDADGKDHLWLIQSTNFVLQSTERPIALHFSGGYVGDSEDDFSHSGRGRFLKGYIQYGKYSSTTRLRLGRFFSYKGTAIGVIDGIEINQKLSRKLHIQVFAGLLGPRNREFELENFDESFSAGGELKWMAGNLWKFARTSLAVSYSTLSRPEGDIRNRLGLSGRANISQRLSMLTILHINTTGSPLRRALGRLRYSSMKWSGMIEAGITSVDIAAYSKLNDFGHMTYPRVRFNLTKRLSGRWSGGLDGTMLLQGGMSGLRLGPMIGTPHGQVGYRLSMGDQALSSGPWVNLQYVPFEGFTVYSSGSMTTYKWEQFEIAEDDLLMLEAGIKYGKMFDKKLEAFIEYQLYQTPQLSSDRRALGGIKLKFDSRRAR